MALLGTGTIAYAQTQISGFINLNKAPTWDAARKACKDIGSEWDLPKADQLDYALTKEVLTEFLSYEIGNPQPQKDLVMWVRSPQEEYNSQLTHTSKALRFNPESKEISEIDFSEEALSELKIFYSQLELIPQESFRTDAEQALFEQAVKEFKKMYPAAQIEFEMFEPYLSSNPLLYYLPQSIFTAEVLMIMQKISPEVKTTMKKNIDYIIQNFSDGLKVVCFK